MIMFGTHVIFLLLEIFIPITTNKFIYCTHIFGKRHLFKIFLNIYSRNLRKPWENVFIDIVINYGELIMSFFLLNFLYLYTNPFQDIKKLLCFWFCLLLGLIVCVFSCSKLQWTSIWFSCTELQYRNTFVIFMSWMSLTNIEKFEVFVWKNFWSFILQSALLFC